MEKYHELVSGFKEKNILIIGDVILDEYLFGSVNRISPEAPIPVIHIKKNEFRLGGASNVANAIVSLGAKCTVIGQVGKDLNKESFVQELGKKGINHYLIEREDYATIKKTRIVAQNQQMLRIDDEMLKKIKDEHAQRILEYVQANRDRFDLIIVSDYNKGVITPFLVNGLKQIGIRIIADTKPKNVELFEGVYAMTPNLKEAKEITRKDDIEEIGNDFVLKYNTNLVLTRGADGVSLFDKETRGHQHLGVTAKEVFDVSGAGDTFVATFALSTACNANLFDSVHMANLASGVVVGKFGTSFVTTDELRLALLQRSYA